MLSPHSYYFSLLDFLSFLVIFLYIHCVYLFDGYKFRKILIAEYEKNFHSVHFLFFFLYFLFLLEEEKSSRKKRKTPKGKLYLERSEQISEPSP